MSVGHCGNGCSEVGAPRYREREPQSFWGAWADIGNCEDTGCFCASIGECAERIRAEGRDPRPWPKLNFAERR